MWKVFWNEYNRHDGAVYIYKIPAHQTYSHMLRGALSLRDWMGNQLADQLCSSCASNLIPSTVVPAAAKRIQRENTMVMEHLARTSLAAAQLTPKRTFVKPVFEKGSKVLFCR